MRKAILILAFVGFQPFLAAENAQSIALICSSRTTGLEYDFSFFLHAGLAAYKLNDQTTNAMGVRLNLGVGFPQANGSLIFVSEPKSNPKGVGAGMGLRLAGGYPIDDTVLVGAYLLGLKGSARNSGELGIQLAVRFGNESLF
jgi:hypothetical protein